MNKSGSNFWIMAAGLIAAPLLMSAPAAAEALPLTPAVTDSAAPVATPGPPCYPGNIPCHLSTLSSALGIGR